MAYDDEVASRRQSQPTEKEEHMEQVIVKDHHSYGANMGTWAILGFLVFIALLWAIVHQTCRHSDHHTENLRGMDKLGYEIGFRGKQLDDIQYDERAGFAAAQYRHDMNERFGVRYGDQTQRLCTAPPAYCGDHRGNRYGGVVNGSQFSETNTAAYDRSVL